jgi:hypothetical protein
MRKEKCEHLNVDVDVWEEYSDPDHYTTYQRYVCDDCGEEVDEPEAPDFTYSTLEEQI